MMPGLDPRKMQQMMKQLGIQQVDIQAEEVIIRTAEKDIIISDPQVAKVNMMGQINFQISGQVTEHKRVTQLSISPEDVQAVREQTGADEATAKKALEQNQGDLAAAILALKNSP